MAEDEGVRGPGRARAGDADSAVPAQFVDDRRAGDLGAGLEVQRAAAGAPDGQEGVLDLERRVLAADDHAPV